MTPGRTYGMTRNRPITFDTDVLEAIEETAEALTVSRSRLVNGICREWLMTYELPPRTARTQGGPDAG